MRGVSIYSAYYCIQFNGIGLWQSILRLVPIMLKFLPIILFYYSQDTAYYSNNRLDSCLLFSIILTLIITIKTQEHTSYTSTHTTDNCTVT